MRLHRLHPFLFAAVPILTIVSGNPGESSPGDLLLVLGATMAVVGAVYAAARYLLPRPAGERLAGLVALLVAGGLLGFRTAVDFFESAGVPGAGPMVALAGLAVGAACLAWAWRRPQPLQRVESFLTLMFGLLVAFGATDVAADHRRSAERIRESGMLARMAVPIPGPEPAPGPQRDVYVLVLDQYASERVLREQFHYDNRPFLDSLRALGFHLPPVVRSNYAHTMLSVPSLLNAAHLAPLAAELEPRDSDPTVANYLVRHSRIAEFLQARGYRYVFYPSQWWYATSEARADVEPQVWDGETLWRALGRTELRRAVLRASSVPGRFLNVARTDADHVRRTLRGVALARRFGRPVFVVTHVISPHPPYTVDAGCNSPPRRMSYTGQLECLNRQVLALVTELIRSSAVAPIIILQGDHGTDALRFNDWPSSDAVPAAAARERFAAFGAYYLPEGGARAFGDTVTVVNVLGNVLRHYYGADLPREPDLHYLSIDRAPFRFRKVDPAWLAPSRLTVREAGMRDGAGPAAP